ncbi:MAG: Gfo/Idh/MocA family oxidoreductase [Mariniphaga sp.]|nr:Gfo/Idh/MocA family oxidoreductase [Mariniphaga sp.]
MSNLNRRDFMKKTLVSGAVVSVVPRYVLGGTGYTPPSEKIQVAVIGTGNRMNILIQAFNKQPDCATVALCDVDNTRLTQFAAKFSDKVDTYEDYRRIIERKDIDAVVVATPDHWHAPMTVDACEAGKDVYLEKPISNTIPAAVQILEAAQKHKRVVQLGTQQRSWPHFQECARMIQDGLIGDVTQVIVNHVSRYGRSRPQPAQPEQVPEDFNWEMFQGPAPRHPYESARRRWRSYYDYGGGGITDWGVHFIDIVHMALGYDVQAPTFTAAASMPNPDPELVPGTYTISYKYDDFVMSFVSATRPTTEISRGPSFYGMKGYLFVNRAGYIIRPTSGRGVEASFEAKDFLLDDSVTSGRAAHDVHVRNWMDCIKSRQKPTCNVEVGFYSSLPPLLGRQAIQEGRALTWDPMTKTAKRV